MLKDTHDTSSLWNLNLKNPTRTSLTSASINHAANNVYKLQNKKDIVQYLHQACCSAVPSHPHGLKGSKQATSQPGMGSLLT
jgi:hypothetical protein